MFFGGEKPFNRKKAVNRGSAVKFRWFQNELKLDH